MWFWKLLILHRNQKGFEVEFTIYIGETCHHFKTRIEEHTKKDNKSHIFEHLHSTKHALTLMYNSLYFKIIHKATSKFDLKIKEPLHINLRKLKCKTTSFSSHTFTIAFVPFILFCLCFFFSVFLFHLLFS